MKSQSPSTLWTVRFGVLLALGALAAIGCGGKGVGDVADSDSTGAARGGAPAMQPDPSPPCQGVCLPRLVSEVPIPNNVLLRELSVDPGRRRLYAAGVRLDVSNLPMIKVTMLPKSGHVIVNPATGRYAATDEEGRTLFVFNPDDTLYDSLRLPGNLVAISVDAATSRYYVTTQATQGQLVIYDEESRGVHASRPLNISPFRAIFDPGSYEVHVNWYQEPMMGMGYAYQSLTLDENYDARESRSGYVLATDPAKRRVYVESSPFSRLEIRGSGTWELIEPPIDSDAYWVAPDPILDRLYVKQLYAVAVFDQASGAKLATLPLEEGSFVLEVAFNPGDDRIYVAVYTASAEAKLQVFATQ